MKRSQLLKSLACALLILSLSANTSFGTLLFMDSFDHYAYTDLARKGWSALGSGTIQSAIKRTGAQALLLNSSSKSTKHIVTGSPTTAVVGYAVYLSALGSHIELLGDASTLNVKVTFLGDGSIRAYDGAAGTLGTTATGIVSTGAWYYLEMKVKIDNSTGTVEIKLNGAQVLNLTGLDTQTSTSAVVAEIYLRGFNGVSAYFDDLYICDVAGSLNNDFLGVVAVTALVPDGAGTNTGLTPSTGANWQNVDEIPPDDDTTYNQSTATGQTDTYDFGAAAVTGTILGVQLTSTIKNIDVGSVNARNVVRSGGTPAETESGDLALGGTFLMWSTIWEQEPVDATAWTNTNINTSEFGVKHDS